MQSSGWEGQLAEIVREAETAFSSASTSKDLYELKVKFLGKSGSFQSVMKAMGALPAAEKPAAGKLVNEAKQRLEARYAEVESALKSKELGERLAAESLDLTLPGTAWTPGAQHPVTLVMDEIAEIMSRLGYAVRTGPLIESDRNNFEALNVPKDHPARDMQDTFYIDEHHVLRTQTSPIQIRVMESEAPPLRVVAPGAVFRCDADVSHSPNFHQIEGLCVDRRVSMADLKGTITFFVGEFFGRGLKTRFRPSFFPFTEPSAEMDCQCPLCKGKGCRMCGQSGWIEIGGCGLVHPNVFQSAGLDPKQWQGFAFGFGIERMAIIKYGITDIRLYTENDVRFLKQFPS
ncbi:MAG TPA: phenylalanine--tRNA ligase subunit alpha [Pseudobdellovibrionaceae bacterium]|nr:phenylalanine--tRNA ligase subunit alpha [Pseudobdellovibrionaceae bacterium]